MSAIEKIESQFAQLPREAQLSLVERLAHAVRNGKSQSSRHVFASGDLVGCVKTGTRQNDSATLRKIIRERIHEKNR